MSTTTTHTPLPWTIGGDGADLFGPKDESGSYPHIADCQPEASGLLGMTTVDRANAEFILKAVSYHEEMLEWLNACVDEVCMSGEAPKLVLEVREFLARVEAQP